MVDVSVDDVSNGVLFGAAYYREYQQGEYQQRECRLDRDLELMVEAGFSFLRVGESVWSTWEPSDGHFDLDWLLPVLEAAQAHDVGIILGTPTYAVPPWLQRAHPEIAVQRADGSRVPWGSRQEIDFTHPVFRQYAERVIKKVIGRYATHPAVIGVQLDNEPGLHLLHNDHVFAGFVDRLRKHYGSVEALNRAWGLTYWSHRLSSWDELWRPVGNSTPSYDLAWRRYQADLTTEFIGWQGRIVRELLPDDRFVTTCIAYNRPALDDVDLGRVLDISSGNAYYELQDGLAWDGAANDLAPQTQWFARSTSQLFQLADRMYATKQQNFLVTETNATTIAGSHVNRPFYDGQLRQAAWALVSRGASAIGYWHWNTLPFGAETYWGGVLGHDGKPGRTYAEIARVGRELQSAGRTLAQLEPDLDVALIYSAECRWAMEYQPPLALADDLTGDRQSYSRIVEAFYAGAFDAGLQAGFVSVDQLGSDPDALVRRYPVLVAPALYAVDDDLLDLLEAYAAQGGELILTMRTAYADEEARARTATAPDRLAAAAGVHYQEFSNITGELSLTAEDSIEIPSDAGASGWIDGLELDGATALAGYDHPHFGRWPAWTMHSYGRGRVTYVGSLPNRSFSKTVFSSLVARASAEVWPVLPPGVTVHSATNSAGERIWFVHNWSWQRQTLSSPAHLTEVTDAGWRSGEIMLGPWDVRVFREQAPEPGGLPNRPKG